MSQVSRRFLSTSNKVDPPPIFDRIDEQRILMSLPCDSTYQRKASEEDMQEAIRDGLYQVLPVDPDIQFVFYKWGRFEEQALAVAEEQVTRARNPFDRQGSPATEVNPIPVLEQLKLEFVSKYPDFSSNLAKYEENCSQRYLARAEAEAAGVGKKKLRKKYPLPPEMNEMILTQLIFTDDPHEHIF